MAQVKRNYDAKSLILAEVIYWVLWIVLLALTAGGMKLLQFIHTGPYPFVNGVLLVIKFGISFYISLLIVAWSLPKPKAGIHKTGSPEVKKWFINFQFAKIWNIPFIKHILFSSFVLRPIFLRACGAKIPFDMAPSAFMRINDPFMIEIGKGAVIGLDCMFAGHTFVGDKLALMKVRVGENCTIGAYSSLTAGATVGNNVVLGRGCTLYPLSKIPDNVKVGHSCHISQGTKIEPGSTIEPYTQT
jgi:acyl-[acyl carrier protein]--UDP-N-acetylglucosamine O-acyltransferase